MYELCCDDMELKYGQKAKTCNMDTDSFIFCIKAEGIYIETAKGVEIRSDTSYCELETPLPRRKYKRLKKIGDK